MSFSKASVRDADVAGKRVLVRVDFNVPLAYPQYIESEEAYEQFGDAILDDEPPGIVVDDTRIQAALPTIELLRERGAAVVLVAHLGRPEGKFDPRLSMEPVSARLSELLGVKVWQAPRVIGSDNEEMTRELQPGDVTLLENVRFEPGETANDRGLAEELAALADVFVDDAFGVAHRAHASNVGVAQILPGYAGLLLEREVTELTRVVEEPDRPLVVVLGGAKVADKLDVIERFLDHADQILIGGAMCFSFFAARGIAIGDSLMHDNAPMLAEMMLALAEESDCELILPVDLGIAERFESDAQRRELDGVEVPEGWMGLDIGRKTADAYAEAIASAGTVLWNGPMGAFEIEPFALGTRLVAEAVATATATTVVGGGDSVAALQQMGLTDEVDWVSTGGGASLELLEGKKLPGVEALRDA